MGTTTSMKGNNNLNDGEQKPERREIIAKMMGTSA
jgi:hypothetical protein